MISILKDKFDSEYRLLLYEPNIVLNGLYFTGFHTGKIGPYNLYVYVQEQYFSVTYLEYERRGFYYRNQLKDLLTPGCEELKWATTWFIDALALGYQKQAVELKEYIRAQLLLDLANYD